MKSFKTLFNPWIIIFIAFLFIACASAGIKHQRLLQSKQKHFTSFESRPLYLSKSLASRESITLPLDRVFSLASNLASASSHNSIIKFQPTTVKLSPLKHSSFIEFQGKEQNKDRPRFGKQILAPEEISSNESILSDLRTPLPHEISEIVVLNQNLTFLFVFPAKVLIFQEMANTFIVTNTYEVNEFNQKKSQLLNFYPISESHVIGNSQDTNEFYIFDQKGYTLLINEAEISSLEHVHFFERGSLEFFTAQRENGFKHCRVNLTSNKIQLIKKFESTDELGLNLLNFPVIIQNRQLEIYDISFNRDSSEIYILDINLGVVKFKYGAQKVNQNNKTLFAYEISPNTTELIIRQRGCQALDFIPNDRLVLICEQRKRRYFIEAYYNQNLKVFEKQPPVFHNCNFEDLQVTKEFYLAFEDSSVDVFWPSKNNFIPETAHNKKHINLLGMQAYKIHQNLQGRLHLYSVRNNILFKEQIDEEKYSLSVGANEPIKKLFKIQVFGSCESLFFNVNDKKQHFSTKFNQEEINKLNDLMASNIQSAAEKSKQLCKITLPIQLEASQYIFENRGKFTLAIGILIICFLIAFTLICICTKKYLGLERAAHQTLRQLKNGGKINPQFVL